jgi:hypothetical protein
MKDPQPTTSPAHRRGRLLLSLPLALLLGLSGALLVVATPAAAEPRCPIVLEPPPECEQPPPPSDDWMDGTGGQTPVPTETTPPTPPPADTLRCDKKATARTQYFQRPSNLLAARFQFSVEYCLNQNDLIARARPSIPSFTPALPPSLGTLAEIRSVPFASSIPTTEVPVPQYSLTFTLEFSYQPPGGALQIYQDVVTLTITGSQSFQLSFFSRTV